MNSGAGLGVAAALGGGLPAGGYVVAATAATAGRLLTTPAAILPVRLLRRRPTMRLLAEG